jgi:hypothetical protein
MINSVWKYQGQEMNNFLQCCHASFLRLILLIRNFRGEVSKDLKIGYFVRAELGI